MIVRVCFSSRSGPGLSPGHYPDSGSLIRKKCCFVESGCLKVQQEEALGENASVPEEISPKD